MFRLGVDLGGSKIEIAALDEKGGERLRRRVATPSDDYRAVIDTVRSLVFGAEQVLGEKGSVGVGAPGSVSRATGRLKNSNTLCLSGQPLKEDLEFALQREIRIANDANCFALSESADGAAAGARVVFGVIIGTGVGGGIVVDGKILEGANAIAGEWGHNTLPFLDERDAPVRNCYCGRRGCIETWLSGPGFAADHAARAGPRGGFAAPLQDARQIAAAALAGEAMASESLRWYADRLARALSQVINILDPDVIVLGGGLSNMAYLYETLPSLLAPHVFSDRVDTRVVKNLHGDSSGVRGAAWLWGR